MSALTTEPQGPSPTQARALTLCPSPTPKLVTDAATLRQEVTAARRLGKVVGFVPTMGYLHDGHLSLLQTARRECDLVVLSVFVNPTQFGANEDLSRYPRDPEGDALKAASTGVDLIFSPPPEVLYPMARTLTWVNVEGLDEPLCGGSRPGHFRGVTTVVARLFNLVQPDRAYFGEKDHQQLTLIRRMTAELLWPIEIIPCPTVREPDGLAMSSRNAYLSPEDRVRARSLYSALSAARQAYAGGERRAEALLNIARGVLTSVDAIDYLSLVDPDTLAPLVDDVQGAALMAVAAVVSGTRLIDNARLDRPEAASNTAWP